MTDPQQTTYHAGDRVPVGVCAGKHGLVPEHTWTPWTPALVNQHTGVVSFYQRKCRGCLSEELRAAAYIPPEELP